MVLSLSMIASCTKLEPNEQDSIVIKESGSGTTSGDAVALLESSYKDLDAFCDQANLYAMYEHTSDELIPPTRGTDWGDNGVWRTLYSHTWDATHQQVRDNWNNLNSRSYKTNQVLAAGNVKPEQAAEAKFLRAFYMFYVMDLYGQVPFRAITDGVDVNPKVFSRSEAFDFIVKDLTEALPKLTSIGPKATNTTASKAAAYALLARLYLNKAVYTAASAEGPFTFAPADMTKVVEYCDLVTAEGFSLEGKDNYFNNFTLNAKNEIILTVRHDSGTPQNRIYMVLHYDQKPSGWNGFATLADFYNKFEDSDDRKHGKSPAAKGEDYYGIQRGFLEGQQYNDKGDPIINSRNNKPLAFTKDVTLSGASTEKGIRVMKYHPKDYDAGAQYVLLRYADVYLMKAEAIMRGGTGTPPALKMVNDLRDSRKASALTKLDEAAMLDERGRELYWEGLRRMDLIRFGKFNTTWSEKTNTEAFRNLFPIPQIAIDSNPNLKQNPGY